MTTTKITSPFTAGMLLIAAMLTGLSFAGVAAGVTRAQLRNPSPPAAVHKVAIVTPCDR
jgi:hypothetical protein